MIDLSKVRLWTPEELAAEFEMTGRAQDTAWVIKALCTLAARRKILLHRILTWQQSLKPYEDHLPDDLVSSIEAELQPEKS